MNFNIQNIFYLLFRLAPFIIVSFFSLQSILNWDLKGVMYLVGLLIATCFTTFVGKNNPFKQEMENKTLISELPNPRCNIITLGNDGFVLSMIPVSIMTYSYSLFYLLMFMINMARTSSSNNSTYKNISTSSLNGIMGQNIPILILFPILILSETYWIISNKCLYGARPIMSILSAIILGGLFGLMWASFIVYTGKKDLQFIATSGMDVCSRPSKMVYRCKPSSLATTAILST
jgi:hypothetical protein